MPHFPTQAISEKPALVFSSQPSDPNLSGHLPGHPHAINSLVVQNLGTEEVVAVVRDDGDVDTFLVRHVLQAIERRAESGNTIGVIADEVRPIFQDNVESSAWGLAVHSEARILATSSNKHEVRIFKFGLIVVDDDAHSSDEVELEEDDYYPETEAEDVRTAQSRTSRKQDVTLHVINGNANIPYIAFCNTGDDPEGRWLLTTDIGGFCRVMDLRRSACSQTFRFGQSFVGAGSGGFDRLNAGWSIMFLDKRSFRPEPKLNAALGMHNQESLPNARDNARIWDISRTTKSIHGASEPFIYHRPRKRATISRPSLGVRSPSGQSITSSTAESQGTSTRRSTASGVPESSVEFDIDIGDQNAGSDEDDGGVDIEVEHGATEADDEDEMMTVAPDEDEDAEDGEWQVGIVDGDNDPEDEGTEDSVAFTSFYNGDSVCGNEPRFARLADGSLCDDLPCPILHTSVRNVYLLQPSNQQLTPGPWLPPMVGLANPLRQPIQHNYEHLRMFERVNMCAQIPALGVVVVASQKGRALVLGLTKLAADADYPPGTGDMASKKTTYGMRVECILPFASQERRNERPFALLHGLAAGPMQGYEGAKKERKTWRVMLMYQDHSILSYEISRNSKDDETGVDVEGLVV